MHELSITVELVRMIREELRAHPEARLKTAHVCLGVLRQVEQTTLQFCFEAIIRDTELTGAQLCIEPVEAAARCKQCGLEFAVEDKWFECPRCAASDADLLRGDELGLTSLDIEAVTTEAGTGTKESHTCLPADKLSNGG
jgi:hydrogenase nickel incorporation protein HypA/HybF